MNLSFLIKITAVILNQISNKNAKPFVYRKIVHPNSGHLEITDNIFGPVTVVFSEESL